MTRPGTVPDDAQDWNRLQQQVAALQREVARSGWKTGDMKCSAVAVVEDGWLEADGTAVTSVNATLRQALIDAGSPYGKNDAGDPLLPDMSRRVAMGRSPSTVLGTAIGEEAHLLLEAESGLPQHGHSINDPGHRHFIDESFSSNSGNAAAVATSPAQFPANSLTSLSQTGITAVDNAGIDAAQAHNNMQPSIALVWLVKL
jgi:microcystin-dependent protein